MSIIASFVRHHGNKKLGFCEGLFHLKNKNENFPYHVESTNESSHNVLFPQISCSSHNFMLAIFFSVICVYQLV